MNFWSLAVEEQFYVLWPITFAAALAFLGSDRARLRAVLCLAALSALAMAVLLQLGASESRVYYGTDPTCSD